MGADFGCCENNNMISVCVFYFTNKLCWFYCSSIFTLSEVLLLLMFICSMVEASIIEHVWARRKMLWVSFSHIFCEFAILPDVNLRNRQSQKQVTFFSLTFIQLLNRYHWFCLFKYCSCLPCVLYQLRPY